MDEPFLPRVNIGDSSTPRRKLSPGYLDRTPTARSSTVKFFTNDAILPFITTPTAAPVDLIINCHRSNSAPALFTQERGLIRVDSLLTKQRRRLNTPSFISVALLCLLLYITIGVTVFTYTRDMFKGTQTINLIDALYFTVVTLCTIGYGDIVPDTTFTKLTTCIFILVGFGFIDILLNGLLTYILDRQEEVLLAAVDKNRFNKMVRTYVIDEQKGRMRIRIKMCLALGVVVLCITIGTVAVHFIEDLTWVDSFYMSVTSVTTVGYGDYAFKTPAGRCFAIIWLLASTLAVAKAFLYLTEYRIERRNHRMAKEVLQKKLTLGDFVAADMDHDGYISKAEYVIFKLKEMGQIAEKDIEQICKQFDTIKNSHHSRISVSDLMESETDSNTSSRQR